MTLVIDVLFGALVTVAAVLFAVNAVIIALQLLHRPGDAERVARIARPFASYFLMGGRDFPDRDRSRHA